MQLQIAWIRICRAETNVQLRVKYNIVLPDEYWVTGIIILQELCSSYAWRRNPPVQGNNSNLGVLEKRMIYCSQVHSKSNV